MDDNKRQRTIVDPAVREADQRFQQMMASFRGMSAGLRNPDGSIKLPTSDPCVTRVEG